MAYPNLHSGPGFNFSDPVKDKFGVRFVSARARAVLFPDMVC